MSAPTRLEFEVFVSVLSWIQKRHGVESGVCERLEGFARQDAAVVASPRIDGSAFLCIECGSEIVGVSS